MKKVLSLLLVFSFLLVALSGCASMSPEKNESESDSKDEGSNDSKRDPYALDENIPYQLSFTSNGDGTCSVTDIVFNSQYFEDFELEIPETSPDGDVVTGIAWGRTLDSVLYNRCPIFVLPEDLETVQDDLYDKTYTESYNKFIAEGMAENKAEKWAEAEAQIMTGKLKFYKLYDISTMSEQNRDYMCEMFPILEYMPIMILEPTLNSTEIVRLASRWDTYSPTFVREQREKIKEKLRDQGLDEQAIEELMVPEKFENKVKKGTNGFANCSAHMQNVSFPDSLISVSEGSFEHFACGFAYSSPNTIVLSEEADDTTIKEFLKYNLRETFLMRESLPAGIDWNWIKQNCAFDVQEVYLYSEVQPPESAYEESWIKYWHYWGNTPMVWE